MTDTGVVNKETCGMCREGIMKELNGLWDKSDKFAEALTELKVISATQTTILTQTNKILEKQDSRQDKQDARTDRILEAQVKNTKSVNDDKVWKQPWFKIVVVTVCFLIIVIIGTAIGINIFAMWIELVK